MDKAKLKDEIYLVLEHNILRFKNGLNTAEILAVSKTVDYLFNKGYIK